LFYVFLGAGGNKKGGGSANTISSGHREQLNKLMNTLDANSPHFVRYKKH
jgi:myosin heavy subunit